MMNENLLRIIYKYIYLLIFYYLFTNSWLWFFAYNDSNVEVINKIMTVGTILTSILIPFLLFIDSRKIDIPTIYLILILVSSFIYPLMGVVLFSLIFISHKHQ
ncbi:hypothetical protein SAMN05444362_101670 [Dysgonomonas macrotermitis]|uniref:Uncharacterized protein n=1 Tax=Dysgonomonas macrotermitis TaxID=1346286 RepID=A0A1M4UQR2_9BACT|nr:hypothetical protein SAMN05444362_101670 [Dysgonomonas macrotermitis]